MSSERTGPAALFTIEDGRYVPSQSTRGGWSDGAQHGSPPSGILARAIEGIPTPVEMEPVRITVDLFREVPLTPLEVHTELVRDGRRIQLARATLISDGVPVGSAMGLKVRRGAVPLDPPKTDVLEPPPDGLARLDVRSRMHTDDVVRFHTDAVEIRTVDDSFFGLGEGRSWMRLRRPLVHGETPSPFVVAATLADVANGNSTCLDPGAWIYVNPDITLYVHRPLRGEWVGMVSTAYQQPTGIGMTDTALYDSCGRMGRVVQAQVLAPR